MTYTLTHNDISIDLHSYGASIAALSMPDRRGSVQNIVMGLPTESDYAGTHPFFGSTIGRYAGRIAGASFRMGNGPDSRLEEPELYQLPANDGPHCLHGGPGGLHHLEWEAQQQQQPQQQQRGATDGDSIVLRCVSPHLDQGFPGTLEVRLRVTLGPVGGALGAAPGTSRARDGGTSRARDGASPLAERLMQQLIRGAISTRPELRPELRPLAAVSFSYEASSDVATPVNLTNHSYFNLAGLPQGTQHAERVDGHRVWIPSGKVLELNDDRIPTGRMRDVAGTELDLRGGLGSVPESLAGVPSSVPGLLSSVPGLQPESLAAQLGPRIAALEEAGVGGFDHYYVLGSSTSDRTAGLQPAAVALHEESGRVLMLFTSEPGLQFYTGGMLPDASRYLAFCLEPGAYPDAMHHRHFPQRLAAPGRPYRQESVLVLGLLR